MHALTSSPATDPAAIYRHRDALYASDMLIVALKELDFFSWLAAGPQTVDAICGHYNFRARPVDVMTTLFVASGWLRRDGRELQLTESAREHLVRSSPWFIGPYFPPVKDRPIATDLLECLKTGKPANFANRKDHDDWHKAMETPDFAREFTAMMDCRGVLLAQALAKQLELGGRSRLLDIAGGSGVYACSLCAHFPELRASVLEKPPVDQIAAQLIQERGLGERVNVVAQDMLTRRFPEGYDVHLLSNVLHDWDVILVRKLLQSSAVALETGGWLVVHDAFLNADKTGPLTVAEYSVLLMHVTQGRCYSVREITDWAAEAGLKLLRQAPSAAGRSALVFEKE